MIIGSGSASFEILRYLVERLPVMVTPRWVSTECQPIAVRNVLHYLVACLEVPETDRHDPGHRRRRRPDLPRAHGDHGRGFVVCRGVSIIPVPVLTPRLSSLWIHLVTPLSARIARPLAEGLRNRVVCRDDRAARADAPAACSPCREAIDAALGTRRTQREVETAWSDAGRDARRSRLGRWQVFIDRRDDRDRGRADRVVRAVCRVGGGHGYYAADWLWRLRGAMDRLVGGPGLRRGRRDPERVAYGDALDFWRVTDVENRTACSSCGPR